MKKDLVEAMDIVLRSVFDNNPVDGFFQCRNWQTNESGTLRLMVVENKHYYVASIITGTYYVSLEYMANRWRVLWATPERVQAFATEDVSVALDKFSSSVEEVIGTRV